MGKKSTILNRKEEWFNYNINLLTSCLDHSITNLYAGIDLQNKLEKLRDLEKETEEKAWRPQTGKPDLNSIEGNHLDKKRKYLSNSILQIRKKTSLLQSEISDFRSRIEQQINEIKEYTSRDDQEYDDSEIILTNNQDIWS
ncbi:hypothetical protein WA026_017522 [Henosepilachna vigintioctopunctata]|uniref:Uncharacterized protein n=1 Tax=Henosepilachna vigintioctopunctata TaxID=420089 RepID=A0AAW1V0C0_9CUCU